MKCPKCGYLGFENVESCRNCGYQFSLTAAPPAPELSLRDSRGEVQPLDDLSLIDRAMLEGEERPFREARQPAGASAVPSARWTDAVAELPLFGAGPNDDVPLITRASSPRPPLSVRRATPEVPRLRTEARPLLFDLSQSGLEPTPTLLHVAQSHVITETSTPRIIVAVPSRDDSASLTRRYVASALDVGILMLTDLLVLYFTMQICGLLLGDVNLLPRLPLAAFLIVQNVAYFVVFTAGGQTLGKMAMGVRVVEEDSDRAPSFSRASLRTMAWIPLALPGGLGLLTALVGDEARGLHDRVAGTRVVRAAA